MCLVSGGVRKKAAKATSTSFWYFVSLGMAEIIGTGMLLFLGCLGGVPSIAHVAPPALQSGLIFGITVAAIVQVS